MYLVQICKGLSDIQGIGVFAAEDIPAGTVVYQHVPAEFFCSYTSDQFEQLTPETQAFIAHYGFRGTDKRWNIHLDDIRLLNDNPDTPNLTYKEGQGIVALRDIRAGEELTQDYGECADPGWLREKRANYRRNS